MDEINYRRKAEVALKESEEKYRKLFEEMTPLKKKWVAQLTFTITEDKDLVRAAARECDTLFSN